MITITPEQTALIPIYRQKWREIGLSTKPLDRPIATAAHPHRLQHHRLSRTGNYFL